MATGGPLLVCYDGSEAAKTALEAAASVFAVREAVIACYWQPFASSSKRFGVDIRELVQHPDDINRREGQLAQQVADEGVRLARSLGLDAQGRAVKIDGPIEEAILAHADEIEPAAIVLGARSRSSLRSLLIGSTANEIIQRATRPVFLAPSDRLAERRRIELSQQDPASV